MLMIAMHGNSIFCIQLEKNKKTKKKLGKMLDKNGIVGYY